MYLNVINVFDTKGRIKVEANKEFLNDCIPDEKFFRLTV